MNQFTLSGLYARFLTLAIPSRATGSNASMRFLFQGRDDLVETLDIGGTDATDNGAFQCR